jgi:hypothetical protein
MSRAAADWDRLSDIAEEHFGFAPEYIRMGVKQFRWRDEGRSLGVDLDELNNLEAAFRRLPQQEELGVVIGHVSPVRIPALTSVTLSVTYATQSDDAHVYVFYCNSQQLGYKRLELKQDNKAARTWSVTIPGDDVVPGFLDYYFGANSGRWGDYAETIARRPPFHVPVSQAESRPVFSYSAPAAPATGNSVTLHISVRDPSKIKSVHVNYKPMPSYYEWRQIEMAPDSHGNYTADVRLTPEGILYYFDAIDEAGNAANYPNFLDRTPYFTIDSWAPMSTEQP